MGAAWSLLPTATAPAGIRGDHRRVTRCPSRRATGAYRHRMTLRRRLRILFAVLAVLAAGCSSGGGQRPSGDHLLVARGRRHVEHRFVLVERWVLGIDHLHDRQGSRRSQRGQGGRARHLRSGLGHVRLRGWIPFHARQRFRADAPGTQAPTRWPGTPPAKEPGRTGPSRWSKAPLPKPAASRSSSSPTA